MKYWTEYNGHVPDTRGVRKFFDNTIYTFDIETTSFLVLHNKIIPACKYLDLSDDERKQCIFLSNMYIWQFSINDTVYYGRTWDEFRGFLIRLFHWGTRDKKYVFVHNLPYEFQFLRNILKFDSVFARKSRKPIKAFCEEFNIEFRCSLMLTNCKLEKVAENYNLDVKKLTGNLDYDKLRNSKTELTEKELEYCENDCLVVYEYIKKELETFKEIKYIPLTSTGHIRKELKDIVMSNYNYRNKVRNSINIDGHVYNLLLQAFAGRLYTSAIGYIAGTLMKGDIKSFDFCSSYPYVLTTQKFPMTEFRKVIIKDINEMSKDYAYLIRCKMRNIKCNYYNNFISSSKCISIKGGKYDNGRLISADEIEITLIDLDFYFLVDCYKQKDTEIEILECYRSKYDYLPIEYVNFILDKYENKTKYKNVEGKEDVYAIEKAKVNRIVWNDLY